MVEIGNEFSGIASWYGRDFHSKLTANGEVYDMYALTAAHKTLPMNTIVKVTNTTNDKTVVVRINDRGPFKDARIIDLSFTAAKEIAMDNVGTAPVKLEILGFDGTIAAQGSVKQNRIIGNLMLQIGAYNFYENAIDSVNKYSSIDSNYKAILKTYDNNGVPFYRVMIAGFKSETEVRDFAKRNNLRDSFIVAE
jgi:rare lipoprotein A